MSSDVLWSLYRFTTVVLCCTGLVQMRRCCRETLAGLPALQRVSLHTHSHICTYLHSMPSGSFRYFPYVLCVFSTARVFAFVLYVSMYFQEK